MTRTIFSKVMWVGRTAATVFGLALVLALVFGVATTAIGATGGNFILGKANSATTASRLTASIAGPTLTLVNNSTDAAATALNIGVASGQAPLKVNASAGKATNLNVDKLDGLEASDLAEPRGYAHVKPEGFIDTSYPRKGVNDITIPEGETSLYCFDLTFTPKTAVGSPHPNNSAVVGTATRDLDSNPGNDLVGQRCPPNYDAAAKIYGSSTGTDAAINFQVVFE